MEAEAAMFSHYHASPFAHGVVVGILVATAALTLAAVLFSVLKADQYDLDHWKLNFRTPVNSMWMNLGYWYVGY